eukprot:1143199-Pelagomonas_calceolata.AAC.2
MNGASGRGEDQRRPSQDLHMPAEIVFTGCFWGYSSWCWRTSAYSSMMAGLRSQAPPSLLQL